MKTILLFLFLLIGCNLYCQNLNDTIKGNIKDVYGEVLPGAYVRIIYNDKHISEAISDIKGDYVIAVPDSLVEFKVVFSYPGFEDKVVIVNREKKKNEK